MAVALYFLAVLLVIIGTYCLFTAGSIALLKLLRKNKRFYYQTGHFIGVSGMLYRMKRNAVGLANICILSTMVMVMISGTLALYLGTGKIIDARYPADFQIEVRYEAGGEDPFDGAALMAGTKAFLTEQGAGVTGERTVTYLELQHHVGRDLRRLDGAEGDRAAPQAARPTSSPPRAMPPLPAGKPLFSRTDRRRCAARACPPGR